MSSSEQRRDAARPDWLIMQSAETLRDSTRRGTSPFRRRFLRARRTITHWFVAGWLLRGDGVHIASARIFKEFGYQTLKSWSRERRVIGKAEYLEKAPIRDSSSPLCRLNAWMRVQLHRAEEMLAAVVRDRNR